MDSKIIYSFHLNNKGDSNLIIDSVSTGCNCTDLKISAKIIPPNEQAVITGILDKSGYKISDTIYTLVLIKSNTQNILDSKKVAFYFSRDSIVKVIE
ncbi:MAG: DUF1573 domain-containing protein [Sphingobacterium sp.]